VSAKNGPSNSPVRQKRQVMLKHFPTYASIIDGLAPQPTSSFSFITALKNGEHFSESRTLRILCPLNFIYLMLSFQTFQLVFHRRFMMRELTPEKLL
jgi:hypothetical protein